MPVPVLVPLVVLTTTLTLKSDSKPVKVYVRKPRGTLYWGGAGLDGSYIQPQLQAFMKAGIRSVSVGLTNTAAADIPAPGKVIGTMIDAMRAGLPIRYEDHDEWTISKGMDSMDGQFNLIGYSYGSLLAAQTANSYANQGHIVDHLVLIGSPIDGGFLKSLQANRNIKKVVIIDLTGKGDPLYAGMTQSELFEAIPRLVDQFSSGNAEGHFYYADIVSDSPRRWSALAEEVFNAGLR